MPNGLNRNGKREYLSIVIHRSDSDKMKTKTADIKRWHVQERGWNDIGYHFVIEGDGSNHVGRPITVIGAGAEGWNEDSIHICLTGKAGDPFDLDDPQGKTLVQLVAVLCGRHAIAVTEVIGHRDVYTRLGVPQAKTCPGDPVYVKLPALRARVLPYLIKPKGV